MSLTSNITFNKVVSTMALANGTLNGGIQYWQLSSGYLTQVNYHFGNVVSVDLSDFSISEYTDNYYYKDIFTLRNGVKIGIRMYYNSHNSAIEMRGLLRYGTTEVTISGGSIQQPGTTDITHISENMLRTFGLKAVMLTNYGQYQVPEVDETEPLYLDFTIFTAYAQGGGLNTHGANIYSGQSTNSDILSTVGTDSVPYYSAVLYRIDDLATWVTNYKVAGAGDPNDPTTSGEVNPTGTPEEDPSTPGGGGGTYDQTSDPIDFPNLPTGGPLSSGAIQGYLVTQGALTTMMQTLWGLSIETQFKKLLSEPLEALISLVAIPYEPSSVGTSEPISLATVATGAAGYPINNQYDYIDCGSVTITEKWGSALDYAPYTKIEIYLPGIGIRNLEIEDCQASVIHVKYMVDCFTGSCIAFIKCGQSVLYTYTGSLASHIPVSSTSSDRLKNMIQAVGSTAVGLAGGGAAAAGIAVSSAINVALSKTHVNRTGDLAGATSVMGDLVPYLIIHRPIQSLASNYKTFKGYPSNITRTLSALSGYTEVEHIHLTGITGATDTELNEIEQLLKSGVII